MNTIQVRVVSAGLFFLFIFLSGFWLSHSGKPYNIFPFNIHKFIALGAVAFLAIMIYRVHQVAPLSPLQITIIGVTIICFVATIISGGLSSINTPMPVAILRLHQIAPYLTLLSTAVTLYLLLTGTRDWLRVY